MTTDDGWPPLLELRQYTLRPGRRDDLMSLFDAELVESQEQLGMGVYGQFRDLDGPDRFVWLRGYPSDDPERRRQALEAFYGGPVWAAHGEAANATMLDSDDVFLLSPLREHEPCFGQPDRLPFGADPPDSVVDVTVCLLAGPLDGSLADFVATELLVHLAELVGSPVAAFGSSDVPDTFPALPVRADEPVLIWLSRFDDATQHRAYRRRLRESRRWQTELEPRLRNRLRAEPMRLRLAPTGRSRLR
jgi:hypothetical protein